MTPELTVATAQLARLRGMNAAYHRQFSSDIRFTTVVSLALFAAGFALDPRLFLAVPVVALLGTSEPNQDGRPEA